MSDRDPLDMLFELSSLLNTGLDRETLEILSDLTNLGVNPNALAEVVSQLRSESLRLENEMGVAGGGGLGGNKAKAG
eukprot:g16918.t1